MQCAICGSNAVRIREKFPGYMAGLTFDLYDCDSCQTSFASPIGSFPSVYDAIYRHAEVIPGYSRYVAYRELVAKTANPAAALAASEEPYWAAIASALRWQSSKGSARVLEVGSGMGYLTHALRRAGIDATGMDISSRAVEKATATFGNWYRCADMLSVTPEEFGRFDNIVMTEVIEHIENVVGFVSAATRFLADDGELLMTTPNRAYWEKGAVWQTELPPVHWWWFSEESFRQIARRLNLRVSFVDFSEFYRNHRRYRPALKNEPMPTLNADGSVRCPEPNNRWRRWLRRVVEGVGLLEVYFQIMDVRRAENRLKGPRGPCCCAVFKKP